MKKIRGHIEYPKELAFQQGHAKYSLKGVVVHWGTLEHGHYVSVVQRRCPSEGSDKWYFCNDKVISECGEKVVMSQEAYMLFYERARK
jgi:ubiquitin C-terminal hydrolase